MDSANPSNPFDQFGNHPNRPSSRHHSSSSLDNDNMDDDVISQLFGPPDADISVAHTGIPRGIIIQAPLPDPPESISQRSPSISNLQRSNPACPYCRQSNQGIANNNRRHRRPTDTTRLPPPPSRNPVSNATILNPQQQSGVTHGAPSAHSTQFHTTRSQQPSASNRSNNNQPSTLNKSELDRHPEYLASRFDNLCTAFVKSQSNMEKILLQQQEMLHLFLTLDREYRSKQDTIMKQQLDTLTNIATSSKPPQVPHTHFHQSSVDGISFDASQEAPGTTNARPPPSSDQRSIPDNASINS